MRTKCKNILQQHQSKNKTITAAAEPVAAAGPWIRRSRRAASHLPAGPIIPLNWAKSGEEDLASTATPPKGPVTNEHQFTSGNSAEKRRSILAIFVYTAESSRRPNEIITSSLPPAFPDEESTGGMVCALLSLPSPLTWPTGDEVSAACDANEKLSPRDERVKGRKGWRAPRLYLSCLIFLFVVFVLSEAKFLLSILIWPTYCKVMKKQTEPTWIKVHSPCMQESLSFSSCSIRRHRKCRNDGH